MPFLRTFVWSKSQTALSRIWTQVFNFISNDNNCYTKHTLSRCVCVCVCVCVCKLVLMKVSFQLCVCNKTRQGPWGYSFTYKHFSNKTSVIWTKLSINSNFQFYCLSNIIVLFGIICGFTNTFFMYIQVQSTFLNKVTLIKVIFCLNIQYFLRSVTQKIYFYPRTGLYFRTCEDRAGWHLIPCRINPRFFLGHIRTGILCGGLIYGQTDRRWQGVPNFTLYTHPPRPLVSPP